MGTTALLIIDMQPDYMMAVEPDTLEQLITAQGALLEHCARADIPAITIEMANGARTSDRIRAFTSRLPRHKRYSKSDRNAFSESAITAALERYNADNLILTGLFTSECILATAEAALHRRAKTGRNYRVWTSPALIADGDVPQCISTQDHIIVPQYDVHRWYSKNTNYHPSVASLLKALDDNI